MKFIQFDTNSELYKEELELRTEVLRKPLGKVFREEFLQQDSEQLHFSLIDENGVMKACLLIKPLSEEIVKLRQMGVSPGSQGRGLGKRLVEEVEERLKQLGYKHIELHARRYAEGFYLELGYEPVGEEFYEIGIPHIKMGKKL